MAHGIEHAVGVYIVLMGVAVLAGIGAKMLTHLPYTIALILVGLVMALFQVGPEIQETGFGRELVFFVLLPPLLFQGALHIQLTRLARHAIPISLFATVGVVATMLIIAGITFRFNVFDSFMIAVLFGALICTTDPVSVLAIFRENKVAPDLSYLVEGESLFNDGTGVVVFAIVLEMVLNGAEFHAVHAIVEFIKVALGGTFVGLAIGYATYLVLRKLTDNLLENMICLLACYASFWVAEHFHLSGVIGTVCVGLLIGNYGRTLAMNPKTTETVETFFQSLDFLINSLLFIMIGLELQQVKAGSLATHLAPIGIAIAAVLVGRAATVYPLFFATRKVGNYPAKWVHILFWGGLRGSIPIALLLGLPRADALQGYRTELLTIGFGVVCFSLIAQGLTVAPLIRFLGLKSDQHSTESL